MRRVILFLFLFFCLIGSVQATDYYVTTTGNNSASGDIDHPWATPAYAATQAVAGDTIYLSPGTYDISSNPVVMANSGMAENKINFIGNGATLYGDLTTSNWVAFTVTGSYIYVENLSIEHSYCGFYVVTADNVTANKVFVNWTYAQAVKYEDTNDSIFMNGGVSNTTGSGNGLQIATIHTKGIHNITIENNTVKDMWAHNGIDLFNSGSNSEYYLTDIFISNNTVTNISNCALYEHGSNPLLMERIYVRNNIFNSSYNAQVAYLQDSVISDNIFSNMASNSIGCTVPVNRNVTFLRNTYINTRAGDDIYLKSSNGYPIIIDGDSFLSLRHGNLGTIRIKNSVKSFTARLDSATADNATVEYDNGTVFTVSVNNAHGTLTTPSYSSTGSISTLHSLGDGTYPVYTVTRKNYSAKPTTENATVTPNTPVGSELANFTATSTNGNKVDFSVWELQPLKYYAVKQDGVLKETVQTNETGYISFNNSEWSEHTYTVELVPPVAAFSATPFTGNVSSVTVFTDSSTNADSWAWDFDNDGTIDSTLQNPVYSYTSGGTYTVNLTVTNDAGSDSEVKADYITVESEHAPTTLEEWFWYIWSHRWW